MLHCYGSSHMISNGFEHTFQTLPVLIIANSTSIIRKIFLNHLLVRKNDYRTIFIFFITLMFELVA